MKILAANVNDKSLNPVGAPLHSCIVFLGDSSFAIWYQSRTQSPQAPWSAVWSPGETLGKWNFFPQKSGVPIVVRMLSFIKTEVNVSREVGHSRSQSPRFFWSRGQLVMVRETEWLWGREWEVGMLDESLDGNQKS